MAMAAFSNPDPKPKRQPGSNQGRRNNKANKKKQQQNRRSASESAADDLEEFFRSVALTDGVGGRSLCDNHTAYLWSSRAKLVEDEVVPDRDLDWSQVPEDPPLAAGILIVVTSPAGRVRMARTDTRGALGPMIREGGPMSYVYP